MWYNMAMSNKNITDSQEHSDGSGSVDGPDIGQQRKSIRDCLRDKRFGDAADILIATPSLSESDRQKYAGQIVFHLPRKGDPGELPDMLVKLRKCLKPDTLKRYARSMIWDLAQKEDGDRNENLKRACDYLVELCDDMDPRNVASCARRIIWDEIESGALNNAASHLVQLHKHMDRKVATGHAKKLVMKAEQQTDEEAEKIKIMLDSLLTN